LFAHCHHFGEGQGVTGVLLLQESHISIHTWPEYDYAAIDVFMCGEAEPQRAVAYLIEGLQPKQHRYQMVERSPLVFKIYF
jgi:S-adenosylmethionine decarboxylase